MDLKYIRKILNNYKWIDYLMAIVGKLTIWKKIKCHFPNIQNYLGIIKIFTVKYEIITKR